MIEGTTEKPKVVFFARDYQTYLFTKLGSDKYESIFVTLTRKEKKIIESMGFEVGGCFEDYLDTGSQGQVYDCLSTSFFSDRYFGGLSLSERRYILSKEIGFWKELFERYRPIALLNEVIAIEISEVMYIEAQRAGVHYLAWLVSPFPDKQFYWLSNPFHASLNESIFSIDVQDESIIKKAINYVHNFQNKSEKLFYVDNLKNRHDLSILIGEIYAVLKTVLQSLFNVHRSKYLHKYWYGDNSEIRMKINNYLNSFIYKYDKIDDIKKYEVVFYPLHYEPEASIIYFSEFYEDQIALIRNLSKCLNLNQVLVIKEHPQQTGMLLGKKFRDLKKRLSNIAYLPAEYPTKTLIRQSNLIITQTSTAGWEAILLGKPVVVIGKVFYDKYPLVNKFINFEQLRENIRKNNFLIPEKNTTIKFTAQFYNYCKNGNPYPHKDLYNVNNIRKIIKAIEEEVAKLM